MQASDPKTLLIIDDDDIVRESLSAYLQDSGFSVIGARDGDEGLKLYQSYKPDLIICDLRMPSLDGLGVMQALSEMEAHAPVIVVSGAGVMTDVVEALRLGATDYFIKPVVDMQLLEMAVRRALQQEGMKQENLRYRQQLETANAGLKQHLDVLEQDQQAGRYVQLKMLPVTPLDIGDYSIAHHIIPSLYLSGDFVECFKVGENHMTFFIADVSGHGASSAFVTVLLKNLAARLRSAYIHRAYDAVLSPAKLLTNANDEMLALDLGKHVTMFVGVIDMQLNRLRYSVAGHLPMPILSTEQGAHYLEGRGRPVGLFADSAYEEQELDLPDRFSLSLFSDGVLEIIQKPSLQEKEDYLLELYGSTILTTTEIVSKLSLDEVSEAPDDIAVMTVAKL